MKKLLFPLLCIILLICLTGFKKIGVFTGVVTKIIDGDTVYITTQYGGSIKIRIWGLDTPEKWYSKKLTKEANRCLTSKSKIQYLGKLSSEYAKKVLLGKTVYVIPKGIGYYGRMLGVIILPNGDDYGYKIIKDGYSCIYWKTNDIHYRKALNDAKIQRKGLWSINYNLMNCLCFN